MRVLLAIAIAGCGRVAFDPLETRGDATTGDAVDSGDATQAVTCTTEPFDTPDAQWMFWSDTSGFAAVFTGGELQFSIPASMDGYAGIDLVPDRNLTGGRLVVEVPQVTPGTNAEIYMSAAGTNGNSYSIYFSEGGMAAMVIRNAATDAMTARAYNAGSDRWWRMEHVLATNTMEFSTSPDGATWSSLLSTPASVALDSLTIELASGSYLGGNASPGVPRFDNLTYCLP